MFERTFDLSEYVPDTPFRIGKLAVTPTRVPHYRLETYAFRVQSNGAVLTYSGDSAPSDELVESARDADLFVCEATLLRGELDGEPRGHLSLDEAIDAFEASGRSASWSRTARASCRRRTSSSSPTTASSSRSELTRRSRCRNDRACVRRSSERERTSRKGARRARRHRLSAVFLWLAVRNADLGAVRDALAEAGSASSLLTVVVLGVGDGSRQLAGSGSPTRRTSAPVVLRDASRGAGVQQRAAGPHWRALRAGWLSRDAPMSGGRAFGSVVLDRICDVVTLAVFFAIGLQAVASAAWLVRLAVGALLAGCASPSRSSWRGCTRHAARRGEQRARAVVSGQSSSTRSRCSASRSAVAARRPGSG